MIIVVGGIKGGSGKTTLATNLVVQRSHDKVNSKILLIDTDDQRSASDWADQRSALNIPTDWTTIQLSGKAIHKEIQKLALHYDDIIIDAGGRESFSQRSCLSVADKFIIPFRPKSLDVWTLGKVNDIVTEVTTINPNIKCYAVINQADSCGTDNTEAKEALSECQEIHCLPIFIGYRKAFSSAAAKGLGVNELKPVDKKAVQEMTSLYEMIYV